MPQVALGTSMARLNEYPDGAYGDLREAAGGYVGLDAEHVVVGAGADDLILLLAHTFLAAGRRASVDPPTYALYRIATTLTGAEVVGPADEAELQASGKTIQQLQAEAEAAHEFDIQELFDDIGAAASDDGPSVEPGR